MAEEAVNDGLEQEVRVHRYDDSTSKDPTPTHRYNDLFTLIQCIPYKDHKHLKFLMKQELNAHLNCCNAYSHCTHNCELCHYYTVGWQAFSLLIDRMSLDKEHSLNIRIAERMRQVISIMTDCPTLVKNGTCGHNCLSCGL